MLLENSHQYMDNETTRVLIETLEEDFIEIIKEYIHISEGQVMDLRSIDRSDCKQLADIAHSLKGSSGNIGASYLSSMCGELENELRLGNMERFTYYIDEIEGIFNGTKDLLEQLIEEMGDE